MKKLLKKLKGRFPREKLSVGLNIGTSMVKLIKLRFFKESVELSGFDIEPASVDLAPVLKRITQSQDTNKVNISVSGPSTIIRYANFPKMNPEELRQALKFEAQKHIPFSMEGINLDSYILKDDVPDNNMLVLLAAVKKDFINQQLKFMEAAGLKVNVVDIDSLALINAFLFNYSDLENLANETIALLDIGASESNLNILENGSPCLSRDIHIAGNNFTQKIADTLAIDFKSAENVKLKPDNENLKNVTTSVESVLINLATEVRTSFDYYESQSASSVAKIYLSGGGCLSQGLKDMLAGLLGIEVGCWDPFRNIEISKGLDVEGIKTLSSQLAVAVGLALRT